MLRFMLTKAAWRSGMQRSVRLLTDKKDDLCKEMTNLSKTLEETPTACGEKSVKKEESREMYNPCKDIRDTAPNCGDKGEKREMYNPCDELEKKLAAQGTGAGGYDGGALIVQPRTRPEFPGQVRLGFVPEEWFQFFYEKTGVTGPYMFGLGLLTYLVSKEIYVLEHEYYTGLSLAILCVWGVKKFGPSVAKWADQEIDKIEADWKVQREAEVKALIDAIAAEKEEQWRAEGALMLIDAKKENIDLQLEAAYRERVMEVYEEVKRRLDYQVECKNIERRISQKHMVQWIVKNVVSSITPDQEKKTIEKCIGDLSALALRVKAPN